VREGFLVPTAVTTTSDAMYAKIRSILAMDGTTGQAGEVVINLVNEPGKDRTFFRSATAEIQGPYGVSVTTEDTFFLSMRADGVVLVHVGPTVGATTARFTIHKIDGFEYHLGNTETTYAFVEHRPAADVKLLVRIRW
jgi:hypothetical protein